MDSKGVCLGGSADLPVDIRGDTQLRGYGLGRQYLFCVECGDVGQADRAAGDLSVHDSGVLCYTQSTVTEPGDDRGSNSGSDSGKPGLFAGFYQNGELSAGFCSAGEAVSGKLLSDDVRVENISLGVKGRRVPLVAVREERKRIFRKKSV